MGAYALSKGTIYLNADWLSGASKAQIFAVLTEELGHHLDGLLNAVDTPGDEGELLAVLLSTDKAIPGNSRQLPLSQDDKGSISIEGTTLSAERAFSTTTASPPIRAVGYRRTQYEWLNSGSFAAIRSDGSVVSWGSSSTMNIDFDGPANNLKVRQIFSSDIAFAAVRSDGSLVSTGIDYAVLNNNAKVVRISSTLLAFAALLTDGSVFTWGNAGYGGSIEPQYLPNGGYTSLVDFNGPNDNLKVVSIYSSVNAFAAVRDDGSVVTWGGNGGGDSGGVDFDGSNNNLKVVEIISTHTDFAALRDDGSIVTWGSGGASNSSGVDFDGPSNNLKIIRVFATEFSFAAIRSDGSVIAWGPANYEDGNSSNIDFNGPNNNLTVTNIFSSEAAFAALRSDGSIISWGSNNYGGDSNGIDFDGLSNSLKVVSVFATRGAFAALRDDGSVVSWGPAYLGGDSSGVDFDGTNNNLTVTQICAGQVAFAAILSDGSVVSWGDANFGGNSSGVDFDGADNTLRVTEIFSSGNAFAALRNDGSIVTWGAANQGGNSSGINFNGDNNNLKVVALSNPFTDDWSYFAGHAAPTDLNLTSSGILENSPAGTLIGTLSATDPDAGSSFSYALVAGNGTNDADNALVEIVGSQVRVKSGALIDFETNPLLNLNIQVTDNGTPGLTFTKAVTAAVLNVNEAPTDLTFTSSGINENSPAGTVIGTLSATDPDSGSSFTYALVAGNGTNDADNALVEIVGNQVIVKSGAVIDFETNPLLNLNIQVTDNGTPGLTFTKAVTAAVLNVNEIPGLNPATLSLQFLDTAFSATLPTASTGSIAINNSADFNGTIPITYGPASTNGLYGTLAVSSAGLTTYTGNGTAIKNQSTSTLSDTFQVSATDGNTTQTGTYTVSIANPTAENTLLITATSSGSIDGISFGSTATTGPYAGTLLSSINLGAAADTATLTDGAGTTAALTLNGGAGFDRLNANASANNLTLTGLDQGTLDLVSFSSTENIYLAGGNDTVTIQAGGRLSGILDGGAGSNSLIVDGSYTISIGDGGTIVIDNGSGSSSSFSGFQSIGGGTYSGGGDGGTPQTNRLTLNSNSNVVAVTGPNSGTADGTAFTNISDIDLAAGDDYAVLAAVGSLTGTLKGGGGVDDLTLNAGSNTLTLDYQGTGSATSNGNTTATKLADFEIIRLDAGSDTANLTFAATSAISDKQQLRVEGGIDNDSVALNLNQKELSNLQTTNQFTALQAYLTAPTGKSITVNLLQTSLYLSGFETGLISIPTPTYTITPSATSINEGGTLTTSVATTNVASGTTLYYSLSGTGITTTDFSSGALTGSGTIDTDGKLSISHTITNDLTTEGTETVEVKLFSDSARTSQVGSTASVSIVDTSIKPASGLLWSTPVATASNDSAGRLSISGQQLVVAESKRATEGVWGEAVVEAFSRGTGLSQWQVNYGSANKTYIGAVAHAPDGTIFVTGGTREALNGQSYGGAADGWISKISNTGQVLWTKNFSNHLEDDFSNLVVDSQGNAYMAGTISRYGHKSGSGHYMSDYSNLGGDQSYGGSSFTGNWMSAIRKVDANGNIVWTRVDGSFNSGGAGLAIDPGLRVIKSSYTFASVNGQPVITGRDNGNGSNVCDYLISYKLDGTVEWTKMKAQVTVLAVDPSTHYIYIGNQNSLEKLNQAGNVVWSRSLGSYAQDIAVDSVGVIHVITQNGANGLKETTWSPEGISTGSIDYSASGALSPGDLQISADGTRYLTGTISSGVLNGGDDIAQGAKDGVVWAYGSPGATPTYTLTPSAASINEGAVLTSSVTTTNVTTSTKLYYALSGTGIATADFSAGALTGEGITDSTGKFSFTHTLANDLITESDEILSIKLYSDVARTTQVGSTATVSVVDTSLSSKIKEVQLLSSSATPIRYQRNKELTVPINYSTSDDLTTTGLSFKVHYNSSLLSFDSTTGITNKAQADLFQIGATQQDTANTDNDATTDSFIPINIASFTGKFPTTAVPIKLADLIFKAVDKPTDPITGLKDTSINFTETETASGYGFTATSASLKP
ncbi:cadherin domain-containing protein, partial [Synechococcus sp. UW140]|uniref:cadherin domain-containing protein n=1 Tax=Synechococcus sp. UW140 TaxID=368503 RepID=UPI003137B988